MKTHWLKNPNKNYLGHWDIPETGELVLTIKSAAWETVKDPTTGKTQQKRVVHFKEKYKPLICNQTNAKSIVISTGCSFIEDSIGKNIKLYIAKVFDRKNKIEVDAVRIKEESVKKEKQILTPDCQKWQAGIDFLVGGGIMDNLKKAYNISIEHEEQIMEESMNELEKKQDYEQKD